MAVAVPNGQVVVLHGKTRGTISAWVLSKSVDRSYAAWRFKFSRDDPTQRLAIAVVEMPGEHRGHAIALQVLPCFRTVHMFSLHGKCIGGFQVPRYDRLDVSGSCLAHFKSALFTVHVLQSRERAVALFAVMKTQGPSVFFFGNWQQGYKVAFHVSFKFCSATCKTLLTVDMVTGSLAVWDTTYDGLYNLLQFSQEDGCAIVREPSTGTIKCMYATGRVQTLFSGVHDCVRQWHPSIGCMSRTFAKNFLHVMWYPDDEDGRACQAFRMSCARKTWLSACAL